MKICCTCKTPKEATEFHKQHSKPDGLQARCKSCQSIAIKKKDSDGLTYYQQQHPEARLPKSALCLECGEVFTYSQAGRGGRRKFCTRKCRSNSLSKKWYHAHLERARAASRKCANKRRKDPVKGKVIAARKRGGGAGLSPEEIEALFDSQGRRCPVCGTQEPKHANGSAGKWCLDHCHKTKEVRGVLCGTCNSGIGMLRDSGAFLVKAAQYLGYSYGAGILSGDTLRRLKPVEPFIERTVIHGLSAGVSVAGYDIRIREGLTLKPGDFSLASTVEKFSIPNNVMAWVKDKSTWARQGLSVFNTCAEPGWKGVLTLELKHLGDKTLTIKAGIPIAQVVFAFTDFPTSGYGNGKYQDAPPGPTPALFEKP